ncbi:rCG51884, isoform CRA_a [Rattus norvegicus]|uniref:RCG51884, isoform CRA_a n=1 Tax=Rattus norvegicus TaxID=10116 RepID=A6K3S2_RAT|nr:rCG51884, isoform CRA_a [Rattus norvegicus]EDL85429.1 rCG51884, isoform CRA_a [Rattus norvegicus]
MKKNWVLQYVHRKKTVCECSLHVHCASCHP